MFGLGMMEILMILAIALIVVGPQKLPELAKTLGKAMGEFKRSAQDLKRSMDVETTIKEIDIPKTDVNDVLKKNKETEKPDQEPGPYDTGDTSEQDEIKDTSIDNESEEISSDESIDTDPNDSKSDTPA